LPTPILHLSSAKRERQSQGENFLKSLIRRKIWMWLKYVASFHLGYMRELRTDLIDFELKPPKSSLSRKDKHDYLPWKRLDFKVWAFLDRIERETKTRILIPKIGSDESEDIVITGETRWGEIWRDLFVFLEKKSTIVLFFIFITISFSLGMVWQVRAIESTLSHRVPGIFNLHLKIIHFVAIYCFCVYRW